MNQDRLRIAVVDDQQLLVGGLPRRSRREEGRSRPNGAHTTAQPVPCGSGHTDIAGLAEHNPRCPPRLALAGSKLTAVLLGLLGLTRVVYSAAYALSLLTLAGAPIAAWVAGATAWRAKVDAWRAWCCVPDRPL